MAAEHGCWARTCLLSEVLGQEGAVCSLQCARSDCQALAFKVRVCCTSLWPTGAQGLRKDSMLADDCRAAQDRGKRLWPLGTRGTRPGVQVR